MTRSHLLLSIALSCAACAADAAAPPDDTASAELTACWVETGQASVAGFGEFTASGVLLRSEAGELLLLDGGASTMFQEEIEVYSGDDRIFLEAVVGLLAPSVSLPDALAEVGYDAGELDRFAATHVHVDHVGGVMDLPDLPVLMPPAEIELLRRGLDEVLFEVVPAHAERIAPIAQPLELTGPPVAGFDASADLFGDGSAVAVPMPGHTPGSIGVLLELPGGRRVLHVGDALSSLEQLEADVGKGFPLDRTDSDPDVALEIVHRLHALAEDDPALEILPAHDRVAWRAVFGAPGACID